MLTDRELDLIRWAFYDKIYDLESQYARSKMLKIKSNISKEYVDEYKDLLKKVTDNG